MKQTTAISQEAAMFKKNKIPPCVKQDKHTKEEKKNQTQHSFVNRT